MKKHLEFLKTLYIFCFDKGYLIKEGATVEEVTQTKTGEVSIIIKCEIIPGSQK